jgi:hypothetical protein
MKKFAAILLVALAIPALAQSGDQTAGQGGAQAQQKVIKDQTEYNAYMSAAGQQNPQAKAQALEAFLQQYPNTVVKEETLEQLMAAYQAAGDVAKMTDAAQRLLQVNPNNLRALALLVYSKRFQAQSATSTEQATQILGEAAQYAQRGLQAAQNKPAGMTDADYQKLKGGVTVIFNGALGQDALLRKDYANSQKYLLAAVQDPSDANNLQDVYPLATAYLQAPQRDYRNGLFWAAKAVDLAAQNPAAQQQINNFALYYYKKYHGSPDGWQDVLAKAQTAKDPSEIQITAAPPPPTPCQFADTVMKNAGGNVAQMAYGDWLFVLGSGNQQDAEQVWTYLNGKRIPVGGTGATAGAQAKVIKSSADELQLATTDDDIQDNKPDVTLKLATPLAAAKVPPVGSMLTTKYVGTASSYTPLPAQNAGGDQGAAAATAGTTGAAGSTGTTGATGDQAAAGGTNGQAGANGASCQSAGGVMLTLTEGKPEAAAKPAPAHRATTTTHRRTTKH